MRSGDGTGRPVRPRRSLGGRARAGSGVRGGATAGGRDGVVAVVAGTGRTRLPPLRLLAAAGLIGAAAVVAGAGAPWAGEPRLALRNASTVDVTAVMVSPDYRLHWGANLIGGAAIGPGSERSITLPDDDGHCFYDILVEDSAGRQRPNFNQNLCSNPVFEYREE